MINRLELREEKKADTGEGTPRAATEQIRSWLEVLARLLPVRDAERRAISDELEEHLHERVRDLMVGGQDESEAVRVAIEELGEAAELARRYRHANQTRSRRLIMNLTMLGMGAGAVLVGVFALSPNGLTTQPTAYQPSTPQENATLQTTKLRMTADMTMDGFVQTLIDDAKLGVAIDWGAMDDAGLTRETTLGISGGQVPIGRVLEMLAEQTEGCFGWRMEGEMLRLNTAEFFDLRERVLMVYDVRAVIAAVTAPTGLAHEEACSHIGELLTCFVEPNSWEEMGGRLAHYQFVGGKLFIEAPPRMHEKVQWLLEQLVDDADIDVERRGDAGADGPWNAGAPSGPAAPVDR